MKEYLSIFWAFLNVGMFTFGGGYAMIPVVERELVKKRAWLSMDELMDYYTVSQIMPGLIGVNLLIFIGNKRKGPFAGFLGAAGFMLPGLCLITVIALFISNFAEMPAVQCAFAGIRIAVAALILDTVIKLLKGVFKGIKPLLIFVFVFVFSVIPAGLAPAFMRSPAFLVAVSGLAGLLLFRQKKQKPPTENSSGGSLPESPANSEKGTRP